jgi:putative molybdopterin biosynthesis protein
MVEARRKVAPRRPKTGADRVASAIRRAAQQEQFLEVVDRDEAIARFHRHLDLAPLGQESVTLGQAVGRILAEEVVATVDVPGFDRSNVDGFALRASDTAGASAAEPRVLALNAEVLTPGVASRLPVLPGTATVIATGGMIPRGADAVLMVEHTDFDDATGTIRVVRPAAPGQLIAFAGSDLARGETVLRRGKLLTSREIGMLAAVGRAALEVAGPASPCSPPATRSSRRALRCARARSTTATPPRSPLPSRSWAATLSRSGSCRTTRRRWS